MLKHFGSVCLKVYGLLRNILISPIEGEKKFLSEFCEFRNFREGYKKYKNKDRGTESAMTVFGENLIILFSGMLRSCFGRSALLCRQGKNSYNKLFQYKTELERFEPSSTFVMLTGVRKRLLPLTKREGSDSVISNNFSDTAFSRFTSHFSLKRTAFTLAEVLITIGIVGIVASLTIPSLVANYQKQQVVTKLKREYNVISNALRSAQADYGDPEEWELGQVGTIQSASNFADNYLLPYLTVLKKCGTDTSGECAYEYTTLNGNSGPSLAKYSRFILNDGAMIFVSTSSTSVFPKLIYINIDINGNKKPNKMGKDHFVFATTLETTQDIYKPTGRLNANGQTQTRETIKNSIVGCSKNARGAFCSALIIKDGWTIAKDYPW